MDNSLTYGTPARMMPDGCDRCHGESCGQLLPEDKLTMIEGQPFCAACCVCSGCGQPATLMMDGDLLCRACRALHPGCPECGANDFRVQEYDFGMDRETGTRDAGERGICRACGCNADISDFAPRPQFIYQEDGAPLMKLGTEAPEDK